MSNHLKTLDDLEQDLVKQAVENIEARIGAKKTSDPKIKDIIAIVERFRNRGQAAKPSSG